MPSILEWSSHCCRPPLAAAAGGGDSMKTTPQPVPEFVVVVVVAAAAAAAAGGDIGGQEGWGSAIPGWPTGHDGATLVASQRVPPLDDAGADAVADDGPPTASRGW